jgi:hypothetical protein
LYCVRYPVYGPFTSLPAADVFEKEFFNQMVNTQKKEDDIVHGGFHFDTQHRGGWYKYCLDNKHGGKASKVVDFSTSHGLTVENEMGDEDKVESSEKEGIVDG